MNLKQTARLKTPADTDNAQKLKELLSSEWSSLTIKELAELDIPESLFERLLLTWQTLLDREPDGVKLSIALAKSSFSTISFKAFSKALAANQKIDFLALNHIGDDEAAILAQSLQFNHSIVYLNLFGNKISDSGAQALAEALESNATLTWLDLASNRIGDAGARSLANTRTNKPYLRYLNLKNNPIESSGQNALMETALKSITGSNIWITCENNTVQLPCIWS